jgi:AraC-like DNA-binding protein
LSITTTDTGVARSHFCGIAGARSFDVRSEAGDFGFGGFLTSFNSTGLGYCEFRGEVDIDFPPAPFVRQVVHIRGRGRCTTSTAHEMNESAPYALIPAEQKYRIQSTGDYAHIVLRLDSAALAKTLSVLVDRDVSSSLSFHLPETSRSQVSLQLKSIILGYPWRDYSELGIAALEHSLMTTFLLSHFHRYSHLLLDEPERISHQKVALIEDYVEANWDTPLDIQTLCRVSGVNERSIFRYFFSLRGQSPWAVVKMARLKKARHLLQNSASHDSVLGVALACRFQNAGHFARDYFALFGELPSSTLTRRLA